MGKPTPEFQPLQLAVLTVSDSRDADNDTSGDYLREAAREAGHSVVDHAIVPDNLYRVRAIVSRWIASEDVQVVMVNGGTGFNPKNSTPEARMANQTLIFAVPGSTPACRSAWERIIADQVDARTRPCNFVSHLKKL